MDELGFGDKLQLVKHVAQTCQASLLNDCVRYILYRLCSCVLVVVLYAYRLDSIIIIIIIIMPHSV